VQRVTLRSALLAIVVIATAISGVGPFDRATWFLEVAPVLIGLPLAFVAERRCPPSRLLLFLLAAHALILVVGGHYTYARVPLGFWLQDLFGFARNPYDRIGHLAQGFVPAILAREVLLRASPLRPGAWLFFLVVCVCLALSAVYELLEWSVAIAIGAASDAFLGTQGDPWDTQWDMFLALVGALCALLLLARAHDRSIAEVIR
jgi:putative membrane protein